MYHSRVIKRSPNGKLQLNRIALKQLGLLESAETGIELVDWDLELITRYDPAFIIKVGSDPRKRHIVATDYGVDLRMVTEMRRRRKNNLWPFKNELRHVA